MLCGSGDMQTWRSLDNLAQLVREHLCERARLIVIASAACQHRVVQVRHMVGRLNVGNLEACLSADKGLRCEVQAYEMGEEEDGKEWIVRSRLIAARRLWRRGLYC